MRTAEPAQHGSEKRAEGAPHRHATRRRSLAKAITWRMVGSLDTLLLSYLLITYLGPRVGLDHTPREAISAASLIALAEVATKTLLYYLHERFWEWGRWGAGGHRESYARSTTKTATWRILASLDTTFLAWLFTGNVATAASIGGLEVATKLLLYFFHERAWAHIGYGLVAAEPGSPAPDPAPAEPLAS